MGAEMVSRSAMVMVNPSPRAYEVATSRLRALLPHAAMEGAPTTEGFRWTLRIPEEVIVLLSNQDRLRGPWLQLRTTNPGWEGGMELRRYSIRSTRYVFLWLILHLGAVGPIAFFFWDPFGLRRAGGFLPNLFLILPMAALVAAMLALLLGILTPRWTNLGAILTPRGTATGNAWLARGQVAPARTLLEDPRVREILEARRVLRMVTSGPSLSIEAEGSLDALRVPREEAELLARGFGEEVQHRVDGRLAASLAGQVADLILVLSRLQGEGRKSGSASPRGFPGSTGGV